MQKDPTPRKVPGEKLTPDERFARCLVEVLHHEGGFVDHPADPGGATNLGITLGTARAYRLDMDGDGDVDKQDVRLLTVQAVSRVYRDGYWNACRCDDLPAGVDLMVFDLAVNSGPARARRYLQRAAGVAEDGVIGPVTLAAVRGNAARVVSRMEEIREAFFRSLPTFKTFGRGWMRRLDAVTNKAERWVVGLS